MRIAGLILGIISSILGLLSALFFLTSLSLSTSNELEMMGGLVTSRETGLLLSWLTIACFSLGLIGSCLAMSRPKLSGELIIAACIAGILFSAATYFGYVMYALMLVAGIFVLRGSKEIASEVDCEMDDDNKEKTNINDVSLFKMLINPKKYKA